MLGRRIDFVILAKSKIADWLEHFRIVWYKMVTSEQMGTTWEPPMSMITAEVNDRRCELDALMAACTVPVRRFETKVNVHCPDCQNQWQVLLGNDPGSCVRCGHRNPIVAGRDGLRRWSRQRRSR